MRFLSLDVEHFGPVRSAHLEFGPGLNVLYGPNDIGKSHLAEAIRAALLLVPTSARHDVYVPWGADDTPEVTLAFQTGPAERWRVRKTFGAGSKGTALLERATGDGAFHTEAKGREVEGRLRALLGWGVQPPGTGGKRGASGLPETYLSRLLIGKQTEVAAIFASSLADDPDDSGKKRLTAALHAMAQDPLFARVLARAQDRVDQAFSAGGALRRAKDSPLVRAREEVKAAEQRLVDLRQHASGGAGLQAQLTQLLAERAGHAARVSEAQERAARVRDAHGRAGARAAAVARLDEARRALAAMKADQEVAARKAAEVEAHQAALKVADDEHARARASLAEAQAAARAAEERLEAVTAERAGALQLRRQTLETRRAELDGRRAEAARRLEAARKVGALAAEAEARARELAQTRDELARAEAQAALAEATLRHEAARREAHEARRAVREADEAAAQLAARRLELERAGAALTAAAAAAEQAEAAVAAARERLQAVQQEAGAQQRALKEEELARRGLEAQGARERAEAERQRAAELRGARERAAELGRQLEARRADEAGAAAAVTRAEAALGGARGEVARLALVAAYMEWRAAAARRDEAARAAAEVARLREQAGALRGQADALEAALGARALPDHGALSALRGLERELGLAEARLDVGVSVVVVARRGFDLQESVDGAPPETTPAEPGDELECSARQQLQLAIGDVAELTIRGGRPEDRQRADDLRARWQAEVAPVLAAAGAPDLNALDALLRQHAEARAQAASLRQQAGGLEAQADGLGDVAVRLEAATAALGEREAALEGRDPSSLEKEAAGLGLLAPAGPLFSGGEARAPSPAAALDARRKAADAQAAAAQQALEAARVERGQAALRVETAARDAELAGEAAARLAAALGAPDDEVLRRATAALEAAQAALAAVERERGALDEARSGALGDARAQLERAEAARDEAKRALEAARGAREAAHAAVASSEAQLEHRRQAAALVDLPASERRARELEQELVRAGGAGGAPGAAEPPAAAADLARLERASAAAREAASAARAATAGREAAASAAQASLEAAARDLGEPWSAARSSAEAALGGVTSELAGVTTELAALDQGRDDVIEAARQELAAATRRAADAAAAEQARGRAREDAKARVDTALGQLATLQEVAARHDVAAAEAEAVRRQAELDASPAPDPALAHDDAALQAAERAAREAAADHDQAQLAVTRLQAQLEVTGGAAVQERIVDAEQALERLRQREAEVELDYAAWRLLKDALVEAEAKQQTHLGERLVGPVTRRFRELTRAGYGPLALGPNLETSGISVTGAVRPVDALSIGTRDQLSALLRLTVAAELDHALVLDDQLAQSDPGRLDWFSSALRELARRVQVLVLTCRPTDYLKPDEFPPTSSDADRAASLDADGPLRAVDLLRAMTRAAL